MSALWLFFGVVDVAAQGDNGLGTDWTVIGAVLLLLSAFVFLAALRRARQQAASSAGLVAGRDRVLYLVIGVSNLATFSGGGPVGKWIQLGVGVMGLGLAVVGGENRQGLQAGAESLTVVDFAVVIEGVKRDRAGARVCELGSWRNAR